MWALLLQEYDFEEVHHVGITNLDVDEFSRNPTPSDKNLSRARWHENCDQEVVPGWHAVANLTLFSGSVVEVSIHGSELLQIYGKIFPYYISFNRGPCPCLSQ